MHPDNKQVCVHGRTACVQDPQPQEHPPVIKYSQHGHGFCPRETGRTACVPDAHQKFEKNSMHKDPTSIQQGARCPRFQPRESGRTLCVPGRMHWGLSGGHRGLNEKEPILVMILFLFPLMLLAVPKMISCGKARCCRTPNN